MNDFFEADEDATLLTLEEKQALIPTYITLRNELNEAEQRGVLEAERWAFYRRRSKTPLLSQEFLKALHHRMFKDVWQWAGKYRTTARNIGVEPWRISSELRILLDDVQFWVEHQTFGADEIAVRFHHRLVFIHPFPNGNGRHARLMADLLSVALGGTRFSWGRTSLIAASETRRAYIEALQAADQRDYSLLLSFARS